MAEYANPFVSGSHEVPERIDQGVDYGGSGSLAAVARGVITEILGPGASGWPGSYIEYKVTDPKSELYGQYIYYAESVRPTAGLKVGQIVNPGQEIATFNGTWTGTGIELGFGSGNGTSTWAGMRGGGWSPSEDAANDATRSGIEFSNLLGELGAPQGKIEGATIDSAPTLLGAGYTHPIPFGNTVQSIGGGGLSVIPQTANSIYQKGKDTVDVIGTIANFVSNPTHALLTIALVAVGAILVYSGLGKVLGFDSPVKSTVQAISGNVRTAETAA